MRHYRAAWALPIAAPPIKNASVTLDRGRIVSIGSVSSNSSAASKDHIDLGSAVVLPGLVNAHTHLELSLLRDRIVPTESLPEWVDEVLSAEVGTDIETRNAIESSIVELRRHGTALHLSKRLCRRWSFTSFWDSTPPTLMPRLVLR